MRNPEKWWPWAAGGALLLCLVLSRIVPRGYVLACFADIAGIVFLGIATLVMVWNARSARGRQRGFWTLMTAGFALWLGTIVGWAYYEVVLRRELPDPFAGDVILFLHVVPIMAAVGLRPHVAERDERLHLNALNFLMLLVWWIFLYLFVVFPDEYVIMKVGVYTRNYDLLYLVENLLLLAALGLVAMTSRGKWRSLYWNLLGAQSLYTLGSESMNSAIARNQYYSGSLWDVPFLASVCLFVWAALKARKQNLQPEEAVAGPRLWGTVVNRLAMVAILSLPVMGLGVLLWDHSEPVLRQFRLAVTIAAMLVLGSLLFVKQYLLDQQLARLVSDTASSVDSLQRLHRQVVQKEKLASLGQLVSGAAHELDSPLAAILNFSEQLTKNKSLSAEQLSMTYKIGQQAQRTRDLVLDLLSFAQQTPAEKTLVDVGALLQRAVQMQQLHAEGRKVHTQLEVEPSLPQIWGNANQLFQASMQIIDNASDALGDVGGGTLRISARQQNGELILEFSDTGPGLRDPEKVFDPFYTTKPVGKGAGLGLSATYGVVQNHGGQINCCNKPEGGALFVLRFPIAKEAVGAAGASK
ncbi:MAG TPA: HAMP domain-containing sensor histidine kinase [Terriglobales bacterium]